MRRITKKKYTCVVVNKLAVLPGMALFIPLIGGTGGNVGTQSSAIVVQGLANGSLDIKRAGRHLIKEFFTAMLNALIISALVFVYNLIIPADDVVEKARVITMAVTLSLFCVIIFASVFGSLVPIVLEKLKIDPAMIIYMVLSTWLITTFTNYPI